MLIVTKKSLFIFDKSATHIECGGIILISFEGEGTDDNPATVVDT